MAVFPESSSFLQETVSSTRLPPRPPAFHQLIGQYQTSVRNSPLDSAVLDYIDIMPKVLSPGDMKNKIPPTFQPFSDIITGANLWLEANPEKTVWKCETVERKVNPGGKPGEVTVDLDSMCFHESTFGFNCCVFGLRLWLTKKPSDQESVQQLGLLNITPASTMVGAATMTTSVRFIDNKVVLFGNNHVLQTYEGLRQTIDKFQSTIPGSVLNIESTTLKFGEGFTSSSQEDTAEASSWHEMNGSSTKRYTQIIRVFYVKGKPTKPKIHMVEFLPTLTAAPNWNRAPKFAGFEEVSSKAASWLKAQKGIKIASLETRDAPVRTASNSVLDIDTDSTDAMQFQVFHQIKLKFLRVFYIPDADLPSCTHIEMTSRLFVPVRLRPGKFETMTQTMIRINAWMKQTGLPIFGIETVLYLESSGLSEIDDKRSEYNLKKLTGNNWVTAIRVYFPSTYKEPSPDLLPPPPAANQSSTCIIL